MVWVWSDSFLNRSLFLLIYGLTMGTGSVPNLAQFPPSYLHHVVALLRCAALGSGVKFFGCPVEEGDYHATLDIATTLYFRPT